MPVKRRASKMRPAYPATLWSLLDGAPVPPSVEAKGVLLGIIYFNDYPELARDTALHEHAARVLHSWPADWGGGDAG